MTVPAATVTRGAGNFGGIVEPSNGQWEYALPRNARPDGTHRLVMYLHGGGGYTQTLYSTYTGLSGDIRSTFEWLLDQGFVVSNTSHGGEHTWGNDTSLTSLDSWVDYLLALPEVDAAAGVLLLGHSMGHVSAFNYAVRHAANVAGVYGIVPASDLVTHYNGGVEVEPYGLPTEINTAYGLSTSPNAGTLNTTVKNERDPLTRAGELVGVVPWAIDYYSDDTYVPESTVEAFATAIDAEHVWETSTGGHGSWPVTDEKLEAMFATIGWTA